MHVLFAAASCLAERIKVNSITSEVRDGRRLWIKRRRRSAPFTLACANRFFRLAGNRVEALVQTSAWQRWEVECFLQLHGDRYAAFRPDRHSVAAENVPGLGLSHHLDRGTFTREMAAAAARELRRCHALPSAALRGGWSHGDPHAGNFLYDPQEDRARLIDFEILHDRTLSSEERHADDLLVFLQDLIGRVSAEAWLTLAGAFLDAYDRPEIVARLVPRLILPRGIPRLWWAVRTTYLPGAELAKRLELLRETLVPRGLIACR